MLLHVGQLAEAVAESDHLVVDGLFVRELSQALKLLPQLGDQITDRHVLELEGVDGVIDKDLGAAVLAKDIGANELFILTAVDRVSIYYKKPNQRDLSHLTITEAKKYLQEGHFPKGSMGPKIEAAINFLEQGGERVLITSIENAVEAIINNSGTIITKQ